MTVLDECDSAPEIPSADVKSLRPLRMVRTPQFPDKLCAFLFFLLLLPQSNKIVFDLNTTCALMFILD